VSTKMASAAQTKTRCAAAFNGDATDCAGADADADDLMNVLMTNVPDSVAPRKIGRKEKELT